MTDKKSSKVTISRRTFIKNTGMVTGGVVGGSLLGGLLTNRFITKPESDSPGETTGQQLYEARMFFSRKEDFAILSTATERIFPEDDQGPGAIGLGVPYFIDKQLAGSWGTNAKEYMNDPFYQNKDTDDYQEMDTDQDKAGPNTSTKAPTPTPRYQSRQNRGDMFIQGLRSIDSYSKKEFGDTFINIGPEQQDQVLQAFENNDVAMRGVASKTFFNFLLQMTIEGAYADPVYGGNKNMMGWKMKEYPGPRLAYLNEIEKDEFIVMEPESLHNYQ